MKKYILSACVLTAALVACTDDYTDWAPAQQYSQEEAASVSFTVSPTSTIDLGTVTSDSVTIFTPSVAAEAGATAEYKVILEGTQTLTASEQGKVATADLQNAVTALYGRRPVERVISGVAEAYVSINGEVIKKTCPVEVKAIPEAPQISEHYYLIGAPSQWSTTETSLPFIHSGADVYEDPVFTITFPVTEGELWFAVIDDITVEKDDWSYVFGCCEGNGSNGMDGQLARRSELGDEGSWKLDIPADAKFVKMTLNMMDYTYSIAILSFGEYIYIPGDHQGWGPDSAPALRSPKFDGVYSGYSYLQSEFKFTKQRDWSAEYNAGDFATKGEPFGGDNNITVNTPGFYQIVADVPNSTLTATLTSWGIIGPAQPGGWDSDTDMTYNKEEGCWEATIDLAADQIKFRANDDWGINVGGTIDDLVENGDNINVPEAGTYVVKLYLDRSASDKMYCTLTKQ